MEQTQELRMSGIGGSDSAIILGLNPYKTPLQLAREKLGLDAGFKGNAATHWGNLLEDIVAGEYQMTTGRKVARVNKTLRLKDHPQIMAHIDRRIVGHRAVLECKTAGMRSADLWGEDGTDRVPDMYIIQTQHYMLFPQVKEFCDLAALIGGQDYRTYHIEPDRELQDMILVADLKFWDLIQRGDLPDPSNWDDCNLRWKGRVKKASEKYATPQVMEWVDELRRDTVTVKELDKKLEDLECNIKRYMEDYEVLLSPDGQKLHTWKEQKTYSFDEQRFQKDHPDLYQQCCVQSFDKALAKKIPEAEGYWGTTRVFR